MEKLKQWIFGKPKNPLDPRVFHNISLIAFFAWVGLGADGLSSSCYGPEEAFRALGSFTHLALPLALLMAVTVFILSASYSRIIELFPTGGGGYVVASKLLHPKVGMVSGCALLVDYVLTIAISLASAMDAIFSFLPVSWLQYKLAAVLVCLLILTTLNLRGVKESILVLLPIFLLFLATHVVVVVYGIFSHGQDLPRVVGETLSETHRGLAMLGVVPVLAIFLRAFALGGGTFTGIEAVSNGLMVLREPRVATGKRTMLYMAASLAFTAGGILVCYVLHGISPVLGQTLNATLVHRLSDGWLFGHPFFLLTIFSEGALLIIAAQTGFLDGPRVMSNMAIDSWLPRRFTSLSDRLVIKDGILVMAATAGAVLLYSHASVSVLVVMYSINVFITFSLSQLGMIFHEIRTQEPDRWRKLATVSLGFALTSTILIITSVLKFTEGGWMTILITSALVVFCFWVRGHYNETSRALKHLDQILGDLPMTQAPAVPPRTPNKPCALLMVNGYNGIGIHSFLAIHRLFPGHFKNFVFLSVGVIDSDRFKGQSELHNLENSIERDLDKYVHLANSMGLYAESKMNLDTDVIDGLVKVCQQAGEHWPKKVFFTGQLAFQGETFWTRILHNRTTFALQQRLIFDGLQVMILPIRVRLNTPPLPK